MNQQEINEFCKTLYQNGGSIPYETYKYSGLAIVEKINKTDRVLDIGCGTNWFKNYHPNTFGIDPVTEEADFKGTIEEFQTDELFDVALCLGSLHYGDLEDVKARVTKMVSLLKPQAKVFWRIYPGNYAVVRTFDFTVELLEELALEHGFSMIWKPDPNPKAAGLTRIYAEWTRQ